MSDATNVTELLLWVTCMDCGAKRRTLPSCFVCRACLGMNGRIGEQPLAGNPVVRGRNR